MKPTLAPNQVWYNPGGDELHVVLYVAPMKKKGLRGGLISSQYHSNGITAMQLVNDFRKYVYVGEFGVFGA